MSSSTSSFTPFIKLDGEEKFRYIYSSDLDDVQFRIRIGSLSGTVMKIAGPNNVDTFLKFCSDGGNGNQPPLNHQIDLKVQCQLMSNGNPLGPYKETSYKHFETRWEWKEWITFPVRISDLPCDTLIKFTLIETHGPKESPPLGCTCLSIFSKHNNMRKGMYDLKVWPYDGTSDLKCGKLSRLEKVSALNKMKKRYERGQVMKVDWLDKLTFPEMEMIQEKERKSCLDINLMIEFPKVIVDGTDCNIVYFERDADVSCCYVYDPDIIMVPDPDLLLENLAEGKHHKLSRSARSGVSDKDNKPNPHTRDQLTQIVQYPSTKQLTSEEQDLVWKFRFYLMNQKKALTKFLKCLNWDNNSEANQALSLLSSWSPMDIEDALELLSPQFSHPSVRKYAVSRLQEAKDEDLMLYLLQLVQALKYERHDSRLPELILMTELEANIEKEEAAFEHEGIDLITFLIQRASANETLSNYFYWYLMVEIEEHRPLDLKGGDPKMSSSPPPESRIFHMYTTVMNKFLNRLTHGSTDQGNTRKVLERQKVLMDQLVRVMKEVAREKGDRLKKIDKLRGLLKGNETFNFSSFDPLPLPLNPEVKVKGILADKATLFKSALQPSRLSFLTTDDTEYIAILKYGDDLRQDQLILQTITLIDRLLRRENLDLKLTPYRVLATSSKTGFVQFIESISVNDVLEQHNESIHKFFKLHNPSDNPSTYGIVPEVMDTYVKSCAGYCIITYLLGVGDRHLDNLLLTKNGNLFHIDFGYILGRDPKPFPPPMKLSREMVEAMGGVNSDHYREFRKLCYTAFLHLRRNANLILNLFTLMVDATIPDIALEPDKTVKKVHDKFRLDLTDEEAVHFIHGLIDESATAVMASVVEKIHKFAQYWRK